MVFPLPPSHWIKQHQIIGFTGVWFPFMDKKDDELLACGLLISFETQ